MIAIFRHHELRPSNRSSAQPLTTQHCVCVSVCQQKGEVFIFV